MTEPSDFDLAYGPAKIELIDDLVDFQQMALDFVADCAVGAHDIAFLIGDGIDSGWRFYAAEPNADDFIIIMRKGLIEDLPQFTDPEPPTPDVIVDVVDESDFGLKGYTINSAEYLLVAMSNDGEEIRIAQATVIQDDDAAHSGDIRERFDSLVGAIPTP